MADENDPVARRARFTLLRGGADARGRSRWRARWRGPDEPPLVKASVMGSRRPDVVPYESRFPQCPLCQQTGWIPVEGRGARPCPFRNPGRMHMIKVDLGAAQLINRETA